MSFYPLNKFAAVLDMHPRTILRRTENKPNAYWAEGYNPELNTRKVATAFDAPGAVLEKIMEGRDKCLDAEKAADLIKAPKRTFRDRVKKGKYTPFIKVGNLIRFSKEALATQHVERFM